MKRFSLLKMGALTAAIVCLAPPATRADDIDKKTVVTFDQPTEVPGIVLQPGKYVIKLLNSSSNRHIAEIMNERMDHLYALTFTIPAERLWPIDEKENKRILTFYEGKNGQAPAVRHWFWPGETIGQEFLYPKTQASKLAANTGEKVAEGVLPTVAESGQALTPDNEKTVDSEKTVISETREESRPAATPFTASAAELPASPAPVTLIAQNTPPPSPAPAQATEIAQASPATLSPVTPIADATLPETASYIPLIGAFGLISLAMALVMASTKRQRSL